MAKKEFKLASGLYVSVYKRRGNRNLRLSVSPSGEIRVTIPAWAPYRSGVEFAGSKEAWIRSQQKPIRFLQPGQAIGKAHHLQFQAQPVATKVTSRIKQSLITVSHPLSLAIDAKEVQIKAKQACIRALRLQAEQLLPQRLNTLAQTYHFDYKSVSIRHLKSRWGSCDQQKNIVLNLFLMQLPWDLIDYVLLHELTHTQVLKHGPEFWQALGTKLPNAKQHKRELRDHHPLLSGNMS